MNDTQAMRNEGAKWIERITKAETREKAWRKDAAHAEKVYSCDTETHDEGSFYDFNILFSNVETIVPAIYNSTPSPDIRRRFNDKDEVAREFAEMLERAISIQIDDSKFDPEIEAAALDAFLSGRGIVRLRFESEDTEEGGVANERVTYEAVSWRDYRQGKAKRWVDVPWVAYKLSLDRDELERITDAEMYASQFGDDSEKPLLDSSDDGDDIIIWEVWCKATGKVKWIRDSDGVILKMIDDPLGLAGFFPQCEPVQPIKLTGRMTPVCPFVIYKKLADELDQVTRRIRKVMDGVKVRGLQAGIANDDMTSLAEASDNEIVFATNLEQFAATAGLDKSITWWPVEQGIKVLAELYKQREVVKQSIYEITGISDIVRGASDSNETLGAQQIKTQWGSLRIQKMQRLMQRQVRDLFVMTAEVITTKFGYERLQQMTGTQLIVQEPQQPMDEQAMQAYRMQAQKAQGLVQMLEQPVMASWRVDIESDSTIKADMSRAKGEMSEFLNGTAQFFSAMAPLVQQSPQLGQTAAEIYGAFARNFQLGKQAETALDQMIEDARQAVQQAAQQEQQPSPEQQVELAKVEQAKIGIETEKTNLQKAGVDLQKAQAELQKLVMTAEKELREPPEQVVDPMEQREKAIKVSREEIGAEKDMVELEKARTELQGVAIDQDLLKEHKQLTDEINRASELLAGLAQQASRPKKAVYSDSGQFIELRPDEQSIN